MLFNYTSSNVGGISGLHSANNHFSAVLVYSTFIITTPMIFIVKCGWYTLCVSFWCVWRKYMFGFKYYTVNILLSLPGRFKPHLHSNLQILWFHCHSLDSSRVSPDANHEPIVEHSDPFSTHNNHICLPWQ